MAVDLALAIHERVVRLEELRVVAAIGATRESRAHGARLPRAGIARQHHRHEVSRATRRVREHRDAQGTIIPDALDRVEPRRAALPVFPGAGFRHPHVPHRRRAPRHLGRIEPSALEDEEVGIVEPRDEVAQHEVAVVSRGLGRAPLCRALHRRERRQPLVPKLERVAGVVEQQLPLEQREVCRARKRRVRARCAQQEGDGKDRRQHGVSAVKGRSARRLLKTLRASQPFAARGHNAVTDGRPRSCSSDVGMSRRDLMRHDRSPPPTTPLLRVAPLHFLGETRCLSGTGEHANRDHRMIGARNRRLQVFLPLAHRPP